MALIASPAQSCSGVKQVMMLAANKAEMSEAVIPFAKPCGTPSGEPDTRDRQYGVARDSAAPLAKPNPAAI
jgi:hypothetical protein